MWAPCGSIEGCLSGSAAAATAAADATAAASIFLGQVSRIIPSAMGRLARCGVPGNDIATRETDVSSYEAYEEEVVSLERHAFPAGVACGPLLCGDSRGLTLLL